MKSTIEKIVDAALQHIALHLLITPNNHKDRQRLIQCLPSKQSSSTMSDYQRRAMASIQSRLCANADQENRMAPEDIDVLLSSTARFQDVRRNFRDSAHYLIDGDSLVISFAHHANVDLHSYHGNTLHTIFIIERILLTLFHQSNRVNYTVVFFSCHYQHYQHEKPILGLLRTCLIAHLLKNVAPQRPLQVRQFGTWLDNDYTAFVREEKPHFLFYHNMSTFNTENDALLSKETLDTLRSIYSRFGNYHQFHFKCHLYLMNKLILTNTTVKCFVVEFNGACPSAMLQTATRIMSSYKTPIVPEEDYWTACEKVCQSDDVRLAMYLRAILDLIGAKTFEEEPMFTRLTPLLVLHVALLMRLSLIDRHLSPSLKFSPMLTNVLGRFLQQLTLTVSVPGSSLGHSRIADLFDGHLFAFTVCQINERPPNVKFDSTTMDIVQHALAFLNLPTHEDQFQDIVIQMVKSKDLIFSRSKHRREPPASTSRTITRISNPFIDTYLKPLLSSDRPGLTLEFTEPDKIDSILYKGKLLVDCFHLTFSLLHRLSSLACVQGGSYRYFSPLVTKDYRFRSATKSVAYEIIARPSKTTVHIGFERRSIRNCER